MGPHHERRGERCVCMHMKIWNRFGIDGVLKEVEMEFKKQCGGGSGETDSRGQGENFKKKKEKRTETDAEERVMKAIKVNDLEIAHGKSGCKNIFELWYCKSGRGRERSLRSKHIIAHVGKAIESSSANRGQVLDPASRHPCRIGVQNQVLIS